MIFGRGPYLQIFALLPIRRLLARSWAAIHLAQESDHDLLRSGNFSAETLKPETICRVCGVPIRQGGRYCRECAISVSTETVKKVAPSGWIATQTARAQAARSETKQRHDAERKAWDPARHPSWLTEETYQSRVRPRLMDISAGAIAKALDVTWAYASSVRKGKQIPHPRHWLKLAELVGVGKPV